MTSQLGLDHGPYDCYISHNQSGGVVNQGYQLNSDDNGFLVWRDGLAPVFVPQTGNTEFALSAQPPEIDVAVEFEDWSLGAGFEDAPPGLVQRVYNFSQGADASWGSRVYLSPELQTGGTFGSGTTTPQHIIYVPNGKGLVAGVWMVGDISFGYWDGSSLTTNTPTAVNFHDVFLYDNGRTQYVILATKWDQTFVATAIDISNTVPDATSTAAHRNTQTATSAGATSLTVTKPTSTVADDILLAVIVTDESDNVFMVIPTDEEWAPVLIDKDTTNDTSVNVFWKRAGSSEGSDYTFSWGTSGACVASISGYSNVEAGGYPVNATTTATASATTSHSNPALTFNAGSSMVFRFTAALDATVTFSGVTNERADITAGTVSLAVGDELVTDADKTSDADVHTSSGTADSYMGVLALTPAFSAGHRLQFLTQRPSLNSEPVLWGITNQNRLVNTTTPTDQSSWSAADQIFIGGPNDTRVAGMVTVGNDIVVQHTHGLTSYDGVTVEQIFETEGLVLDDQDARPIVHSDGNMYFTYSGTLLQYDGEANRITKIWPRGGQVGNAELNGIITSMTHDEGDIYWSLKNSSSNYYIMKLDPSRPQSVDGEVIWPAHTIAYRGSAECRAVAIIGAGSVGFSSTNPTLAVGDDQSIDFLILPRPGLRPEDDSNVRYDTTADRILNGPFVAFNSQAYPKFLTRGDVEGSDLDANDTIALRFQEPGGSTTTVVTANTNGRTSTAVSTEVEFTTLRPVTLLNNGASTTTPVWKGSVLHATPNPERKRLFQFEVKIGDNLLLEGGPPSNENARHLRDHLFNAVNERVTLRDRWGGSFTVRVLEVQGLGIRKGEPSDFEVISVTAAEV